MKKLTQAQVKTLATTVGAVATALTAVYGAFRTPPEDGAKAAYIVLSDALKEERQARERLAEDTARLRGYLLGYDGVFLDAGEMACPIPDASPDVRDASTENDADSDVTEVLISSPLEDEDDAPVIHRSAVKELPSVEKLFGQ